MSTVNHLPRACTGPGNRPGICAPGGQHLNSILGPLLVLAHTTRSLFARRASSTGGARREKLLVTPARAGAYGRIGSGLPKLSSRFLGLFLGAGRAGILALGRKIAVDQLDHRHRRIVPITVPGLDDAGIAAGS